MTQTQVVDVNGTKWTIEVSCKVCGAKPAIGEYVWSFLFGHKCVVEAETPYEKPLKVGESKGKQGLNS